MNIAAGTVAPRAGCDKLRLVAIYDRSCRTFTINHPISAQKQRNKPVFATIQTYIFVTLLVCICTVFTNLLFWEIVKPCTLLKYNWMIPNCSKIRFLPHYGIKMCVITILSLSKDQSVLICIYFVNVFLTIMIANWKCWIFIKCCAKYLYNMVQDSVFVCGF